LPPVAKEKTETPKAIKPVETRNVKAEKREVTQPAKKGKISEQLKVEEKVTGLKKSSKSLETLEKEQSTRKSLEEALAEIRKKAAIDDIQKRVSRRATAESRAVPAPSEAKGQQGMSSLPGATASSSKNLPGGGPGTGTGTGAGSGSAAGIGSGTGTGIGTGPGTGTGIGSGGVPGGSPWGSSIVDAKLNEYYSTIWARIKKEWSLPENLPKGKTDLETVIVVVIEKDGKVQKSWFEKKSGDTLYDQMAMRAIKKAEPFPPIPKELGDSPFEIGFRFYPE
jgi:TolA protein